ncbi:uncharacterized protein E0L32_010269 [Thyridium curvatum]|uniref:Uncharacterized protein n=1 Tax=Thyridium curvatum TaxID=1093900 RepID=A0A507AT21_9PEZI|nr:uncharacterized protein E0L32_010269 [Thyridium curvatum]TPX08069.1 hypothetical protein E0L32_010269 [Thyridium curvatum]
MPIRFSQALKQPGFFYHGAAFGGNTDVTEAVYNIFIGTDRQQISPDVARERVNQRVKSLFETCLGYRDLYVAVRGSDLFWKTVAVNYLGSSDDLGWEHARMLVHFYARARQTYIGPPVHTGLTQTVDIFIRLGEETSQMAQSSGQLNLAVRSQPTDINEMSRALSNPSPSNTARSVASIIVPVLSTAAWPPFYFGEKDLVFLVYKPVRQALHGITPAAAADSSRLPARPHKRSSAIDLRVFLGYISLTMYNIGSPWALYLAPVAFLDNPTRQKWYFHTAKQSKMFGTLDQFLEYSWSSILAGKDLALGMLTPWFASQAQLGTVGGSAAWAEHDMAARTGMALVLRKTGPPDRPRVQVVLFDPWKNYPPAANEAARLHGQAIFGFREAVIDRVKASTSALGQAPTLEGWWGGRLSYGVADDADSVGITALWIDEILQGVDVLPPSRAIPEIERDEEKRWSDRGFERIPSLEED